MAGHEIYPSSSGLFFCLFKDAIPTAQTKQKKNPATGILEIVCLVGITDSQTITYCQLTKQSVHYTRTYLLTLERLWKFASITGTHCKRCDPV
jgi:hypothetical protein